MLLGSRFLDESADDGPAEQLEYCLSNTGNQEVVLKSVEFCVLRTTTANFLATEMNETLSIELPLVLKPASVHVLMINFKHRSIQMAIGRNERVYTRFTFVSPQVRVYEVFHEITAIHRKPGDLFRDQVWKPFSLGKPT